jgi:hypothetical protein
VAISALDDVDGDGDLDLVVQVGIESFTAEGMFLRIRFYAMTFEGGILGGMDGICIVPRSGRIPQ